MKNSNLPINHKTRGRRTPSAIIVQNDAESGFLDAKAVYVSASLPMLAHIWLVKTPQYPYDVNSHLPNFLILPAGTCTQQCVAKSNNRGSLAVQECFFFFFKKRKNDAFACAHCTFLFCFPRHFFPFNFYICMSYIHNCTREHGHTFCRPSIDRQLSSHLRKRSPKKMGQSRSAPEMDIGRKASLDPYAAGGSQFRAETTGNQLANYSEGLQIDNLTAKGKRDYNKHRAVKIATRKALESKRKMGWNAAPQVDASKTPMLNDPSPFKSVTYKKYHQTKTKKEAKKMKAAYTKVPFTIQRPAGVKMPGINSHGKSPQKGKGRKGARSRPSENRMETMGEEDEDALAQDVVGAGELALKSSVEFPQLVAA